MSHRSLVELGNAIQAHASAIQDGLQSEGLPQPTLRQGGPLLTVLPPSNEADRNALLEGLDELRTLIMGPAPYTIVNAAHARTLEPDERISYAELGKRCGLPISTIRHAVRAAIAFRYFEEPEEGVVTHNAVSMALRIVPGLTDWVGFCTDDVAPASSKWAESVKKYPGSQNTTESAFSLAEGVQENFFSVLAKDPKREKRFANGQELLMAHPARDPIHFANTLDWSGDNCPKTVIDIGGGNGKLLATILTKFPGITKGVVQDLPTVVSQTSVPEVLEDRMSLEGYDFFTPNQRKADVRLFRVILHDWPDVDAIKILRNQIPTLEPGNRIILNEGVVGGPRVGHAVADQMQRYGDLMMHQLFNAHERSRDEWTALFAEADPRLKIESFTLVPPALLSTIVVVWTG